MLLATMSHRRCITCLKFKPDAHFMEGRTKCNRCHRLQRSRPVAEQTVTWPYPIPPAVKRAMRIKQDGRCALCGEARERLYVDHNHATNAVRALLCAPCNNGLGCFRDNIHVLRKAIAYLQRPPASGDPWARDHALQELARFAREPRAGSPLAPDPTAGPSAPLSAL